MRALSLLSLLALPACVAPNSEQACRVVPVAQVRVHMVRRLPYVNALVDGKPAKFLLDTGASNVMITDAAAARLGLPFQVGLASMTQSLAAQTPVRVTQEVRITLAGQALKPLPLAVIPSSSAVDTASGVDGLLGTRALDRFDLDIDLQHRRLTLNEPRDCAAGPSPLPGRSVTYPASPNGFNIMFVPARVDGRALSMLVDTGATSTLFNRDQVGLGDADLAADPSAMARTAGPGSAPLHVHRFDKVEVADVVVSNGHFAVGPLPLTIGGILGTDFWLRHRLWMSFPGRSVTVGLAPPSPAP